MDMHSVQMINLKCLTNYGKDFMSLEFPPSYSNFQMYHRNDRLLTVRIIRIYLFIWNQYLYSICLDVPRLTASAQKHNDQFKTSILNSFLFRKTFLIYFHIFWSWIFLFWTILFCSTYSHRITYESCIKWHLVNMYY